MTKGGKREGAGRKAGIPNKITTEFKEHVNVLLEGAVPQMQEWLEETARENPAKALDIVYKFAQFSFPLVSRQDVQNTVIEVSGDLDKKDKAILKKYKASILEKHSKNCL